MALFDLFERQAPPLLHQVDEAEVAGPEHDDVLVADVLLPALFVDAAPCPCASSSASPTAASFSSPPRSACNRPLLDRTCERARRAPYPLRCLNARPASDRGRRGRRSRTAAARNGPRPRDSPELLVELAKRLHGVVPLEAGVVCNLVIAGERRVDGGTTAENVRDHREDDQVADEHTHRRAHERIGAAPVSARLDVAPALASAAQISSDDLTDESATTRVTLCPFAKKAR